MTPASPPVLPRRAIEACVERIAASPHFARSKRLVRFLRFTVESALDGRSEQLKERTIAVQVYDRKTRYDPRNDPIVRSEAHRLRGKLAAYYAREGACDPIVISYPKGSYVPEIRPNALHPVETLPSCHLIVTGLHDRRSNCGETDAVRTLESALRAGLASRPELKLLGEAPGPRDARLADGG